MKKPARSQVNFEVCRYANERHDVDAIVALGIDRSAVAEIASFVGADQQIIETVFERRPEPPSRPPSRFSDGTFPVFYCALDWETAEKEKLHHIKKKFADPLSFGPIYLERHQCELRGSGFDLRTITWPFLTEPMEEKAYPSCQCVAKKALELGADAIIAQSARREGGTNCPTFQRRALSNGRNLGTYCFVLRNGNIESQSIEGIH